MVFNSFEMVCILMCVNDIKSEPVANLLFCPMLPLLVDWQDSIEKCYVDESIWLIEKMMAENTFPQVV